MLTSQCEGAKTHVRKWLSMHRIRLVQQSGDPSGVLIWNEHVVLPVRCDASPVIELQVWRRYFTDTGLCDEQIGYTSLPLFHVITREQHLVSLALPISSTRTVDSEVSGKKEGTLEFEVQFLDHQRISELASSSSRKRVDLTLHCLKIVDGGDVMLPAPTATLQLLRIPPGSGMHRESTLLYESYVRLPRRTADIAEINASVDLTDALSDIQGHEGVVLAVQLHGVNRDVPASAHISLRKGWRERYESESGRRVWHSLFHSAAVGDGKQTSATPHPHMPVAHVQVSFSVSPSYQTSGAAVLDTIAGKVHVRVQEALFSDGAGYRRTHSEAAAVVRAWLSREENSTDFGETKKRRQTRKALYDDKEGGGWKWTNEMITLAQSVDNSLPKVRFELASEALEAVLIGSVAVPEASAPSEEEWIPLESNTSGTEKLEGHLLVDIRYVPTRVGVFELRFGATRLLVPPAAPVDETFFKCLWNRQTYTTTPAKSADADSHGATTLEIPFDSRQDATTNGRAEPASRLVVQIMGSACHIPDLCLGQCSVDLYAVLERLSLSSDVSDPQCSRFKWYALHNSQEVKQRTGFVSMSVTFRAQQLRSGIRTESDTRSAVTRRQTSRSKSHTAIAESLVVWKKLFYLLDDDGDGKIDLQEFKSVFLRHKGGALYGWQSIRLRDSGSILTRLFSCLPRAAALEATPDGQKLFRALFGESEAAYTVDDTFSPTEAQVEELFLAMDVNKDQVHTLLDPRI